MRIVTWNVNGLAAVLRKGFLRYVSQFDADVACVQEVHSDDIRKDRGDHRTAAG